MSTPTVTPEVSSAPAAAPSTPSPAATPGPAAASTPAAATPPAATPEPKPEFSGDKDPRQHLRDVLQWKEKHPEQKVEQPVVDELKPAVTEQPKPTEAPEKTEEQKTEQPKPAAEPSPLDKLGPLPPETLAATLAEDKALDEFLSKKTVKLADGTEANLKDLMLESTRAAAEGSQYKEMFPTLDTAKLAQEGAQHFFDLDTKFPAIQSVEDFDQFMTETLIPLSYELDAEGKPIADPEIPGAYKTDGSVARFVKFTTDVELGNIAKLGEMLERAAKTDEEREYAKDVTAAVQFLNEFRNNGYSRPGTRPAAGELSPEVKAQLDRAKQIEQNEAQRRSAEAQREHDAFESKVIDSTVDQLKPLIEQALGKTALSDFAKGEVIGHIWEDIAETLEKNKFFNQTIQQLMSRRQYTDQVRDRRVAHNLSYMKNLLYGSATTPGLIEKWITKAGGQVVQQNKDRQDKIATQTEQSRMEPRTSATTAVQQPVTLTDDQIHQKAVQQATEKNGGRAPSHSQILQEVLALKKLRSA